MTAPNIVYTQNLQGKLALSAVITSPTALVDNPSNSNKVLKINCVIISNIDNSNATTITVDIYRSGVAYNIVSGVSITPNTSFTPIDKSLTLYLLEGDTLRVTGSADNRLQAVCSYEEIS